MERTEASIVVAADPDQIMAVIADFERYPEWVSAAREVIITEPATVDGKSRARRVRFDLAAGVLHDQYELEYDWAASGLSVSWHLVASELQELQEGQYQLSQLVPGSTKVTYTLAVEMAVPVIGKLKSRAERAITDMALTELKKRVEG